MTTYGGRPECVWYKNACRTAGCNGLGLIKLLTTGDPVSTTCVSYQNPEHYIPPTDEQIQLFLQGKNPQTPGRLFQFTSPLEEGTGPGLSLKEQFPEVFIPQLEANSPENKDH